MNYQAIRCGLLTCLLTSVAVGAQTPPQQSPQQPIQPPRAQQTPAPPAPGQKPTFVVNIDMVTDDVIPRDSRGQFVADLKPEDFEVLEDGVPQDIAMFKLYQGGRAYNQLAPPPPVQREGIILPPPRPTVDASGRIFILYIDDLHLSFRNTGRLRELVKSVANNLIHEGDMFAIQSTGPSSLAIDLTYDRKRIDEAIKRISGAGLTPKDIIEGPQTAEGPSEIRYRANVAFSTAYETMGTLSQIRDRRKAFIYISEGYDFNPFEKSRNGEGPFGFTNSSNQTNSSGDSTQGTGDTSNQTQTTDDTDPWVRKGNEFADADLVAQLADLTRAANRANVSIYTVDPRGLVGMPDIDNDMDMSEWQTYVQRSIDSLRVLAEQTGGIAVVNQNDFDRALKRIDSETSDYYMIGYYSKNPDPLRRTREITIRVKRPGVQVQARRYYTLKRLPRVK